ncbi:hypothetical protein Franean1_0251 [Parafrankia sp. EAN1pec]|nr:hypothetical protein Franean1_0251 [Frankia sp. EAN1pec]
MSPRVVMVGSGPSPLEPPPWWHPGHPGAALPKHRVRKAGQIRNTGQVRDTSQIRKGRSSAQRRVQALAGPKAADRLDESSHRMAGWWGRLSSGIPASGRNTRHRTPRIRGRWCHRRPLTDMKDIDDLRRHQRPRWTEWTARTGSSDRKGTDVPNRRGDIPIRTTSRREEDRGIG